MSGNSSIFAVLHLSANDRESTTRILGLQINFSTQVNFEKQNE